MKKFVVTIAIIIVLAAGGYYAALTLLNPEKVKALVVSEVNKATGRTLVINGDIEPSYSLIPTLVFHDVALSNAEWGTAEHFLTSEKLAVSFQLIPLLSGDFQLSTLSLSGAKASLETKGAKENWTFEPTGNASAKPADDAETAANTPQETAAETSDNTNSSFRVAQVEIENSSLTYHDLQSGEHHALTIDALKVDDLSATTIESLDLEGAYNDMPLQVTAGRENDLLMLDAALTGNAELKAKGSLSLNDMAFDLKVEGKAAQLKQLLALTGSKSDATQPISFSGSIGGTPELIKISTLEGLYDGHAFKMNGKVNLSQSPIFIEGALNLPSLDLAPPATAGNAGAAAENSAPKSAERVFSDEKLPLEALSGLNASISLNVGQLALEKVTFSDIGTDISLKNSVLTLANLKGTTGEGSFAGNATLNAQQKPAAFNMTLDMKDLTLGQLLSDFAQDDSVTGGKLTSALSLSGNGNSLHTIMADAKGNYDLYIEEATYQTPEDIEQASEFFELLRGGSGSGPVTLNCAVADWEINKGVAESKVIAIKSDAAIVNGDGTVNLGDESLRIGLKARSTALGFADVVPPLVIAGSWQNPSVTLDAQAGLINIGKFALGAATGVGLFAVVGEQFTDKLGITADNNPCLKSIAEAEQKANQADQDPKAAFKEAEDNVRAVRDDIKDNVKGSIKDAEKDVKAIRDGLKGLLKKKE